MARLLITGAAGFIGSRLLELAANRLEWSSIVAVDNLLEGNYPSNHKQKRWLELITKLSNVKFLQIDLCDKSQLSQIPDVDFIIHQAGVAGLDLSWKNFNLYSSNNILATGNLVEWAKEHGVSRFVHASTSSVYGEVAVSNELACPAPNSPYGVTKLASEQTVRVLSQNSPLKYSILRYFSVYGPNQRPDMAYSKFIDCIFRNQEITVTGDLDKVRSNTYVDDIVLCTLGILERHSLIGNEIYNVAGRESIKLSYAIKTIATLIGNVPKINHLPHRVGDQIQTHGDTEKIRQLGLLSELMPFDLGIKKQIEHYLATVNKN